MSRDTNQQYEITESMRLENLARVTFTKPVPKNIISHHAGSVLTQESENDTSNIVETIDYIHAYFEKNAYSSENLIANESVTISKDQLVELLQQLGYRILFSTNYEEQVMNVFNDLITRYLGSLVVKFTEIQVQNFTVKFSAPTNDYGYKLRKLCGRGRLDEVIELLIRGCDIGASDGDLQTSLHYACESNRVDVIKLLYEFSLNKLLLLNSQCKYGFTPLHSACNFGNLDSVRLLLEYKDEIDVNLRDNHGKSVLHVAAARGYENIVDELISFGMNLSVVCKRNMTPLHDCAFFGHMSMYAKYVKHDCFNPTIHDCLGYAAYDYGENVLLFPPNNAFAN